MAFGNIVVVDFSYAIGRFFWFIVCGYAPGWISAPWRSICERHWMGNEKLKLMLRSGVNSG
jgi:hypothetical protein